MAKPNLLYMSPITPALTGNGLAMRAAMILEALAADYAVHLLVIPVVAGATGTAIDPTVAGWCTRIAVHHVAGREDALSRLIARIKDPQERLAAQTAYPRPTLCRFATTAAIQNATQHFRDAAFSEIHVFRLYLAPFADPFLFPGSGDRPRCRLDLDDHESATRRRLASLHEAAGDRDTAALERTESEKYLDMERRYLPRFDRVYVCSDRDRMEIESRYPEADVAVLPHSVRVPPGPAVHRREGPFTFLFVGNLGYYPNEDAVTFLCSDILPRLDVHARRPFRIRIVGSTPSPRVVTDAAHRHVTVMADVHDVAEHYAAADAVVIPLRGGGGTRIKLLEAMSYRRPVVSTTLGAEGIDAVDSVHLLLADTAEDFAIACARLMEHPALGSALADRALELVRANHCPERIRALLVQDHRTRGRLRTSGLGAREAPPAPLSAGSSLDPT